MKVKVFSDMMTIDVSREVEDFLNATNGIQIIDISWFVKGHTTVCILTYFEV